MHHSLILLAKLIDWNAIDHAVYEAKGPKHRRPRLVTGLLYLQHTFDLFDEEVVLGRVENPYWQVFASETYFQTEPLTDPSSLSR